MSKFVVALALFIATFSLTASAVRGEGRPLGEARLERIEKVGTQVQTDNGLPDGYSIKLTEKSAGNSKRTESYYFPSMRFSLSQQVQEFDSSGIQTLSGTRTTVVDVPSGDWNTVSKNATKYWFGTLYESAKGPSKGTYTVNIHPCVGYGYRGLNVICGQVSLKKLAKEKAAVVTLTRTETNESFTLEVTTK